MNFIKNKVGSLLKVNYYSSLKRGRYVDSGRI